MSREYRGFTIHPEYIGYSAADDDLDADWDGERYVQCGGKPILHANTLEGIYHEIDEYWFQQEETA